MPGPGVRVGSNAQGTLCNYLIRELQEKEGQQTVYWAVVQIVLGNPPLQ